MVKVEMKNTLLVVSCVIILNAVMANAASAKVEKTEDTPSNALESVSMKFIRYEELESHEF